MQFQSQQPMIIMPVSGNEPQKACDVPPKVAVAMRFVGMMQCNVMHPVGESDGNETLEIRQFRTLSHHEQVAYESALNLLDSYFCLDRKTT